MEMKRCPDCGKVLSPDDVLLDGVDDNGNHVATYHISKELFDNLCETAKEKGIPFRQFLSEVIQGAMVTAMVKRGKKKCTT
jgi:hypothetical protein